MTNVLPVPGAEGKPTPEDLEKAKHVSVCCVNDGKCQRTPMVIAQAMADARREERQRLVRIAEAHGPLVAMQAIGFKQPKVSK